MSLGQNVFTFFSMGQQKTVQIPTGTANVTYVTVPVRQGVLSVSRLRCSYCVICETSMKKSQTNYEGCTKSLAFLNK